MELVSLIKLLETECFVIGWPFNSNQGNKAKIWAALLILNYNR